MPYVDQRYYDPQGQPSDRELLGEDIDERRVALTEGLWWKGQPATVSTVLLPCAWVSPQGPEFDEPFETAVTADGQPSPVFTLRYAARAAAEAGHAAMVELLQAAHRDRDGQGTPGT